MIPPFVHLHCHSYYSFLSGTMSIDEILDGVVTLGMTAVALTDTNGLYGAIPFYRKARERGIHPIPGVEVDDPGGRVHAVLLPRDNAGFSEICRLVTRRRLEETFRLEGALAGLGPSVFVLTDSEKLLCALSGHRPTGVTCAEVSDTGDPADADRIIRLRRLCAETAIPAVATNRVCFRTPGDREIHRILSAIRRRTTLTDLRDDECAPAGAWLKGPREMARLFREWPAAFRNAARIAASCEVTFRLDEPRLPDIPLPPGETPFSRLCKLCFRGAARRFHPIGPAIVDRLAAELRVIDALGFAPYFLLVHDIVRFARRRRIPFVGRGSAANSLVSCVLGITEVDPLAHDLFFERFLNPERTSLPDIDIDFGWKRRDRVLEHVYAKYGSDRVAMISTHVTFGARAAIREVARAMGISPAEISAFTARVPRARRIDREWMREHFPAFRTLPADREPWRTILEIAGRITGFPRHLSIHPGGIVISPGPLTDLVPLERARKGLVVTQYDMFPVEALGLVKIDLLSQRSLGVLADTLLAIERSGQIPPDLDDTDRIQGDAETRRLIREGQTMGCFYIESPAMRALLRKLRVDDFEMLTAASSVIRPGVAESGMMQQFIECHNGRREPVYLHPAMKELLGKTYGVMIYQEDVIRVAHRIAGMSLGEADLLRRAMSGKLRSRDAMRRLRDRFLDGAASRGVAAQTAAEIWRQIESFAGYAFCKAHSASYALLSFRLAWLKAHHPAEFLAAVVSNRGGFYHHTAYIEEARRMGIRILPPDVNRSAVAFTGLGREIRTGLMQVRGLSASTLAAIEAARAAGGAFTSLGDFRERTGAGLSEMEQMIRVGAFASLGMTRPELLWRLHLMARAGKRGRWPDRADTTGVPNGEASSLFPKASAGAGGDPSPLPSPADAIAIPRFPDYPPERALAIEIETLGYNTGRHPLEAFRHLYRERGLIESSALGGMTGNRVRLLGRLIAAKKTDTRKGEFMQFLSLEDTTGTFEVVLFPARYQRYGALLRDRGPYIVTGRVLEESGCVSIDAERLERVTERF